MSISPFQQPIGQPTTHQHRIALRLVLAIGAATMLCNYLSWLCLTHGLPLITVLIQIGIVAMYVLQIGCALRAYTIRPVGGRSNAATLVTAVVLTILSNLLLLSALSIPAGGSSLKPSDFLGLFCMLSAIGVIWSYEEAKRTIDLHRSWE